MTAADLLQFVEVNEAASSGLIPKRNGRARCRGELWRMAVHGTRSAAGTKVKLRTIKDGRTRYTTPAWIAEYFSALAGQPNAAPTPREQRRRSYANKHETPQMNPAAAATLRRHGLGRAAGLGGE